MSPSPGADASSTSGSTIRYSVHGPVATITLNRPDAANAQSSQMIDELDTAFDRADADTEVRVIVLAAEGKHFSAGHDLKELLAARSTGPRCVRRRKASSATNR